MKYTNDENPYTNLDMPFQEWYGQFQSLLQLWKDMYSNHNWLEAHRKELQELGINPDGFCGDLQKDIEQLTKQILNYE